MSVSSPKTGDLPRPAVEQVMGWIRHEVSQRHVSISTCQRDDASTSSRPLSPKQEAQWQRIRDSLASAEQHVLAGAVMPELGRFHGLTRKVARFIARGVLYVGKIFTNPQRKFNVAALSALRDIHYLLREWDQSQREQQEHDRQALADLKRRLEKLEQNDAQREGAKHAA